eukprot:TRINITY_DN1220_c0_g1_i1.p1 TRINITY_DN1220_c0_g1~~TRINITY_DN1220_c0_g1_i1.p1  ORF type:complete len:150 (+),score=17.34 TRINITY_DN1220_c0_g1_i1:100-549(+)
MKVLTVILRTLGIIASICVGLAGIFGLVNEFRGDYTDAKLHWVDTNRADFNLWTAPLNAGFANACHSVLLIVLAVISILAQLKVSKILSAFAFMGSLSLFGVFYVVVGVFTLGIAGNWGIISGTFAGIVGIIYVLCALIMRSDNGYERI